MAGSRQYEHVIDGKGLAALKSTGLWDCGGVKFQNGGTPTVKRTGHGSSFTI